MADDVCDEDDSSNSGASSESTGQTNQPERIFLTEAVTVSATDTVLWSNKPSKPDSKQQPQSVKVVSKCVRPRTAPRRVLVPPVALFKAHLLEHSEGTVRLRLTHHNDAQRAHITVP